MTKQLIALLSALLACSASKGQSGSSTVSASATSASGAGGAGGAGGGSISTTIGAGGFDPGSGGGGGDGPCVDPSFKLKAADPSEAQLAAAFTKSYTAYDLGTPPGMPSGHLGGCAILFTDKDKLLLVGSSETPEAGLYVIGVKRDACGHIAEWQGTAQKVASAPYMDANLVYAANNTLLYSEWPVAKIGQLLPGGTSPASDVALNVSDSPGGLGFVPSYLPAAGELRALGWPNGTFFHIAAKLNGNLFDIGAATPAKTLAGGPGGFAYVPPGSPQFSKPSLIVAEWSGDKVVTYEVDNQGDPKPETRADFFSSFLKPWGAYFEPVTGDYIFLTWKGVPDKVFIVRGFSPPPPPPKPK
jgi:hypothetical protein